MTDTLPTTAPRPHPTISSETEAKAMIESGMAWMLANAPEKLQGWLGQKPIGRVPTRAELGDDYDPQMRVIHFPGGHPPEGTNLYAAPQPQPEHVRFIIDLRNELLDAAKAGKIKPDILSTATWAKLAELLATG